MNRSLWRWIFRVQREASKTQVAGEKRPIGHTMYVFDGRFCEDELFLSLTLEDLHNLIMRIIIQIQKA